MKRQDFNYELPQELIAQFPHAERSGSRMLAVDRLTGGLQGSTIREFPQLLRAGDLLVFNNTRVIPARLYGEKETGGKVEVLIERLTGGSRAIAQIRASKSPVKGASIKLERGLSLRVVDRVDDMYLIESSEDMSLEMMLQEVGHVPLPPYIDRADESQDRERYQTVFAARSGAVAAPTAGLHFDEALLATLAAMGVQFAFATLHVGAGTFQPVRTEQIEDHQMHSEYVEVGAELCNAVRETRARNGRVIAVGTTAVRSLETAGSARGWIEPYYGDTEIFIYPGYEFNVVDAMLTNFHLPESSLIMLVSAFLGKEKTLAAYQHAIDEQYRFYSYGDAMFIA